MTTFQKIRAYHAALAITATLAYLSGELGPIHDWLGYALAAIIVFRLLWGLVGPRQLGISRFIPNLAEIAQIRWFNHPALGKLMLLGILLSAVTATLTGLALDRDTGMEDFVSELHEGSSDAMLVFVAAHLGYIFMFRSKLFRFMLFRDNPK